MYFFALLGGTLDITPLDLQEQLVGEEERPRFLRKVLQRIREHLHVLFQPIIDTSTRHGLNVPWKITNAIDNKYFKRWIILRARNAVSDKLATL